MRYQDVIDFVAAERELSRTKVLGATRCSTMHIFENVVQLGEATDRTDPANRFKQRLMRRYAKVIEKTGQWSPTIEPSGLAWRSSNGRSR